MKILYYITIVLLLYACSSNPIKVIELNIDKSTIPEGIAVYPKTKEIYISSIHLDKITSSDPSGTTSKDIIRQNAKGYSAGVGMDIKDNYLYALGSNNRQKKSVLLKLDLDTNEIINSFSLPDSIANYLNDLALDCNHNAYITDTEFHKIYKYNSTSGKIELFIEDEQIKYPNGITLSSDQSKLFIDSYESGIRIIDIKTKKILNKPHKQSIKIGIDGLKYYNQYLYAIRNGGKDKSKHGLYRFKLSNTEDDILNKESILINHPKMNIPTTISIVDGYVYILANSQLDNLNQEENKIISPDSLDYTYIIKMKIDRD